MPEILPILLRPKRLSEVIGQGSLVKQIQKQMGSRQPRSILFHGGTGCGKTSLSYIVALSFQCTHQKTWGEPCDDCWNNWSSFAIHEKNASETNGVEEIGEIATLARYRPPMGSQKRVIILDEAQRISSAAQNLLLKHTEKPIDSTVWILCTTEPTKLLPTLRRRFVDYKVKPLDEDGRTLLLIRSAKKAGFKDDVAPLVEEANKQEISSPGILLMALEKFIAGAKAKEALTGLDEGSSINTFDLCKAITAGKWSSSAAILKNAKPEEARWIRAAVSGWLRGCLWRESDSKRLLALSQGLIDLNHMAPLEDSPMLFWLIGVLYQVCRRFRIQQ